MTKHPTRLYSKFSRIFIMSYVTTQLDDESGIQYQGVEDKTNINQIGNMANMLMLIEEVPRGRLDGSMTITKANKTAYLGQEKGNLYLQAVEDALDQNVPSIQVLRVNGGAGSNLNIGCAGAKDSFKVYVAVKDDNMQSFSAAANITEPFTLTVIIDGIEYSEEEPLPSWYSFEGTEEVPPYLPPGYVAPSVMKVKNLDNKNHRIVYKSSNINGQVFIYDNSTAVFKGDNTEAGVCLGPKAANVEINCDGALNSTDTIDISGDWKLEIDGNMVRPIATNINDVIDYLNTNGFEVDVIPDEVLTGFRIRTNLNMSKSPEFHTYRPENAGTNGERVINLANLFEDETFKDAEGWSNWSREMTFEDINFVNSNGGVTIVYTASETPNYWFDFSGISTLKQFFDRMISQGFKAIEYFNGAPNA